MTSTIPQDVLNEIISQLAEDSTMLKACSVVSSSFREPSQRRLFRSVVLDLGQTAENTRLHLTLTRNPILASFIRSIEVGLCETSDVEAVCDVLRMLACHLQLQELKLSNTEFLSAFGTWGRIPERLQSCLLALLHRPSCTILILGDVHFPPTLLRELSHLRHLKLDSVNSILLDDASSPEVACKPTRPQGYLQSLTLWSHAASPRILNALHNPNYFPYLSLSRLHKINAMNQNSDEFQKFLDFSNAYLQEIHVGVNLYLSGTPLQLSQLTRLRALHIRVRGSAMAKPGIWVTQVLTTLPQLSELEVTMDLEGAYQMTVDEWHKIDVLLTQKRHAETLRRVVFHLDGQREEMNRWFFWERMPGLVERGILAGQLSM